MNRQKAQLVVEALKDHFSEEYGVTPDFNLSDHTYDDLSEGSWTVSYEGWSGENPWPYEVTLQSSDESLPIGVFLEPINHYSLGIFDA